MNFQQVKYEAYFVSVLSIMASSVGRKLKRHEDSSTETADLYLVLLVLPENSGNEALITDWTM